MWSKESEIWKVDVRLMSWENTGYPNEKAPVCDHCDMNPSSYWVEEFAMGLCERCFKDLREEQVNEYGLKPLKVD